MLRIDNVIIAGEPGQFRANAESLGWRAHDGRMLVHQTSSVKRAEWFEGKLRILVQDDDQQEQILGLDGIPVDKFDDIWRYFEEQCGVYVKKHKPVATLVEADFDRAMGMIELAADRVDEVPAGSVQKKAREADLMKQVEAVRDGLDQAVAGDKQALNRVFAANGCERIGRMRLVVDTVQVEVYRSDPRWLHLQSKAATIESVLKELGTFKEWRPPENQEHSSLQRRQRMLAAEFRGRQGCEDTDPPAEAAKANADNVAAAEALISEGSFQERQAAIVAAEAAKAQAAADAAAATTTSSNLTKSATGPLVPHRPLISENRQDDEMGDDELRRTAAAKDGRRHTDPTHDARRVRWMRSDSVLEGWVWKRSRYLKRWRRRWFVLMPQYLASFRDRGAPEATERVDAGQIYRVYSADHEVNQARCFCIVVAKRSYFMVCDDEAQKREWMREITKVLGSRS